MSMLRLFLVLTFICGVAYPLVITVFAQGLFAEKAQGSLVHVDGKVIGSTLLAQKFEGAGFFHPRPSAGDYATVSSGASQHSPTHKAGVEAREARRSALPAAGVDAWTTSGSGLDPDIAPETAQAQIPRVAAARGLSIESLQSLVAEHTSPMTWGIWGRPRVNVLELNLALIAKGTHAHSGSTTHWP